MVFVPHRLVYFTQHNALQFHTCCSKGYKLLLSLCCVEFHCWRGCREKGTLVHCWWECRLVRPLWKTVWNFLRKLKMELPFDPAIPLLGLYPKNPETPIQKNLCTPMFIAAQFTIAKYWKQPKCPSANDWIKKLWYIYTMESNKLSSWDVVKHEKTPKSVKTVKNFSYILRFEILL